jgi:site-specific recombinase XerD
VETAIAAVHNFFFVRGVQPALSPAMPSPTFSTREQNKSGLPIEGYSAYSLRHAFAMRLLERGIGLKAIGDLLGHRHLGSTCQYLRLDIDTLRDVALPVPTQAQI